MKWLTLWLCDLGKGLAALVAAFISVSVGIGLATTAFALASGIARNLWLFVPCMATAILVPGLLVYLPRYIYQWRYGFPIKRPHIRFFLKRYKGGQFLNF